MDNKKDKKSQSLSVMLNKLSNKLHKPSPLHSEAYNCLHLNHPHYKFMAISKNSVLFLYLTYTTQIKDQPHKNTTNSRVLTGSGCSKSAYKNTTTGVYVHITIGGQTGRA